MYHSISLPWKPKMPTITFTMCPHYQKVSPHSCCHTYYSQIPLALRYSSLVSYMWVAYIWPLPCNFLLLLYQHNKPPPTQVTYVHSCIFNEFWWQSWLSMCYFQRHKWEKPVDVNANVNIRKVPSAVRTFRYTMKLLLLHICVSKKGILDSSPSQGPQLSE